MPRLLSSLKVLALASLFALPMAAPAFAGQAENALLAKYAGNWKGAGKVVGPDPGTVVCRLTFKPASTGKLSYSGRCSFAGSGSASFRGTMVYNETKKRFEAASSAQGVSTTTAGKRVGNSIVFASKGMDTAYGTASSVMTLSPSSIKMAFTLVDKKGATNASAITFARN